MSKVSACSHQSGLHVNSVNVGGISCRSVCMCVSVCVSVSKVSACSHQSGLHVNSVNVGGTSCLHVAVSHCHVDMVRLLLRRGAHVNARTKPQHNTPLHLACQSNNYKVHPVSTFYCCSCCSSCCCSCSSG